MLINTEDRVGVIYAIELQPTQCVAENVIIEMRTIVSTFQQS